MKAPEWQPIETMPEEKADDVDARFLQAAQAVAVGGHGMLEKFKLWRDERIGRHALIEPLEWFAGGYACAKSNPEQSVPVLGEPPENAAKSIAFMIEELVQECIKNGGNWQERLPTLIQSRLKRFWPAHSIPATELERLRECKVLLSESRKAMRQYEADCDEYPPFHHNKLMERIDAATTQERQP